MSRAPEMVRDAYPTWLTGLDVMDHTLDTPTLDQGHVLVFVPLDHELHFPNELPHTILPSGLDFPYYVADNKDDQARAPKYSPK